VFVELIEQLRCPRPHEESVLVASARRTEARHVVDGALGCPVCGAEFPIVSGVTHFGEPLAAAALDAPSAEVAMRLAAFLELTDARGFALLCGRWTSQTDAILRLTETRLVLVNPPADVPADLASGVIMTRDVVPFTARSARGAALDETSAPFADSAVDAVQPGGRIVGPTTLPLPGGVTELARDPHMWVAQKNAAPDEHPAPRLVSIKRAPR
jgi:hypothetical protein